MLGKCHRVKPAIILLLLTLLLGGCRVAAPAPQPTGAPTVTLSAASGEVDVPFETIAQDDNGANSSSTPSSVRLVLLTSPEQIKDIGHWVTPQTLEALQQVDFEQYAVIALFRGTFGTNSYHTEIDYVTKRNQTLTVYAQFWEPNSNGAAGTEITAPYHLVKIDKQQASSQQLELVLQARMLTPTPAPGFLSPLFDYLDGPTP